MVAWQNQILNLQKSRFVRDVALVAGGTAGAQLISAGFAPLLTRQYGPAAYGVLGAFLAIVAIMTNVAGMTYPIAIVLPENDRKARMLALLAVAIATLLALLIAIVVWRLGPQVEAWIAMPGVAGLILLLPLTVLLTTMLSVSRQWLIRRGLFKVTAAAGVAQAFVANGVKAGIGFFAPSASALVAVGALAPALHILFMSSGLRDLVKPRDRAHPSPNRIAGLRQVAWEYRDFPLYRAPQHLLNSFGFAVPTLLLASTYGASEAGFYAITQTVMGLPSVLIGKAVGDVFYPRVTESVRKGKPAHLEIGKATIALFLIGLLPFGFIVLAGPELFSFVFGAEWQQAGHYARWLAPFFLLNLANKPSVAAIAPLGLQPQLLGYEVVATTLKCAGFLVGFYWIRDDIASVALFSGAGALAYVALIAFVVSKARKACR